MPFFDYTLPEHLIAQHPAAERDAARLLVVRRATARPVGGTPRGFPPTPPPALEHRTFRDLPDLLAPGDLVVLNDTRVLPARVVGRRESTGGRWEGLFLRTTEAGLWEMLAQTRTGKQVLNVAPGNEATVCVPAEGDTVAVLGDNRKLLLFPIAEVPEMSRGRGVRLQRYRDGGLGDARVFTLAEGLSWIDSSGRQKSETALRDWIGGRGQAGRLPPKGFNRSNRFGP